MGNETGSSNLDKETAGASLTRLRESAPEENELNKYLTETVTNLEPYSTKHDNYLQDYLSEIEASGYLYDFYSSVNVSYNKLIDDVSYSIGEVERVDTGGTVYGDTGSYTPTTTTSTNDEYVMDQVGSKGTLSTNNEYEMKLVDSIETLNTNDEYEMKQVDSIETLNTNDEYVGEQTGTVEQIVTGLGATVGAVTAGNVNIETNSSSTSYENYQSDSSETWNNLNDDYKTNLSNKLQELGFTENEINTIKNGVIDVPEISVNAVSSKLEEAYKNNPSIRNELIEQYGFDIYNSDGSVNKDKLSLAMLMDDKNGKDSYSLISLLHNKYNLDIVDQTKYSNLSSRLTDLIETNSSIREEIIKQYGFDIYNDDGSINGDRLSLAMLIDNKDTKDGYDLVNYLDSNYPVEDTSSILDNVVNPLSNTSNVKTGSFSAVPILAGLGVAGVAGGTAFVKLKNKKEKEEDYEKSKKKEVKEKDQNSWLKKIGVDLNNIELKDSDEKEDYLDENY